MKWQINLVCFLMSPELGPALVYDLAYKKFLFLSTEKKIESDVVSLGIREGTPTRICKLCCTYMIFSDYKEFDHGHTYILPNTHLLKNDVCQVKDNNIRI